MISLKGKGHFGGKTSHNTHQDSTSAPALWWRGNPTLRDPDFLSSYSRSPQSSSFLSPCTLSRRPHPLLSPPKLKCTYLSRPRAANAQSDTSVASPGQRSASSDENSPSSADGYRIHYLARPSCSTGRAMWWAEELGSLCFWLDINSLRKPSSWRSFLFEQWPCCTSRPRKHALPNSSPSLLMCCTWSGQPCFFILGLVLFRM